MEKKKKSNSAKRTPPIKDKSVKTDKSTNPYKGKSVRAKGGKASNNATLQYTESDIITGKIDGTNKGYGFLVMPTGGDLFVSAADLNGASHGDTVKAVMISKRKGAGEARVVEIVSRSEFRIVGTFRKSKSGSGSGFVTPDDLRHNRDIHIEDYRTLGAADGEKVVVKVIEYPPNLNPEGEVMEVLGFEGDRGVDVLSIIRSYNLYEEFPKRVLKDAELVPQSVTEQEIKKRKDFRDDLVITIDGDDSKDFDDAVSVVKKGENYVLSVHIADVANYVTAGSKLDREALKRGTSVYFCDRVLPMLPVELSNGICSLNEGLDRLTLSIVMEVDRHGNVIKHKISEGVIKSRARMTYTNVSKILDGDKALMAEYDFLVPMLKDMLALSKIMYAKREARGNIEFDIAESKIELDDNGKAINVCKYPRLVSHRIIEEFMLLANETIAERFFGLKIPFVYRSHLSPPTEKVESLLNFLAALGINFGENTANPQPKDFSNLLKNVDPKLVNVVSRVTLRSMTKASYEPTNGGHFGLAAQFYCHFTSPIRRYPDLMIHRIIKTYLNEGAGSAAKFADIVVEASKTSSERERLAEQAERKVDDLKKAEFMSTKIGCEFDGVISGVTEWGIFVELDNTCEGLLRTENLPDGGYVYNADLHRLSSGANIYKLGDSISIVVDSVNEDRVNFKLKDMNSIS